MPSSLTEFYGRPDIARVPIADIPPLRIAIAWRDADPVPPAVAAFAAVVRELAAQNAG